MEKTMEEIVSAVTTKTPPILLKAYKLLLSYAKATGTLVSVHDNNYQPIPEVYQDYIQTEKNTCFYCIKYMEQDPNSPDLVNTPCDEMHVNAIKEAHRFGGSHIYMCDLGFMFWTSPLYSEGSYAGSLLGTGLLGVDGQEMIQSLTEITRGELSEEELRHHPAKYPLGQSRKIKALAELLLVLAESLSTGSEDYHKILKRRAEQQFDLSNQIAELKKQYPLEKLSSGYPLDKERQLLAAIKRGDNARGRNILNEILAILLFSNPDHFKFIQCRAMELVVLLSRANITPGNSEEVLLERNNYYLCRIQEAKSIEELTDVLHTIVDRMAGDIFSFRGIRHAAALRKAERYIWDHYTRRISLQEIAGISGLSAPYFSTIFKEEMGENLSSYLNRLRVEKAGYLLIETDLSLSEIAGSCGFEDQSWFSKIFKNYTGISPGKYRAQKGGMISEISEDNLSVNYRSLIEK
ncbi:MAG: helix-turn-helix domain-containing protein [Spirochaetaceae bacterium]|jgi:AraC-like DNA-binding protein/ligand-binding sensor protein|nr:helix-turn-helix domain-containing protein [Spirochaetaceae bacterium]